MQVFKLMPLIIRIATVLFLALLPTGRSSGQSGTGALHGQVIDPSGAAVPGATVEVTASGGQTSTAKTGKDGGYEVKALAPGKYSVKASAKGFQTYQAPEVQVGAGPSQKQDLPLAIEVKQQKVEVTENATQLDVSPERNAGAIVLSGKDLDALSDDPDQLQSDLDALAGPSIGPSGGQMYIDGFSAGQLPPKSSIREVRINQNPFSAEFDKLGYGRIEIFSKPGTDQLHGQFYVLGNDSAFNSRNPFLGHTTLPGYDTVQFNGNVGGPLSKRASFFLDGQYRDINQVQVVNAELQPGHTFTQAVPNPRGRTNVSPRLDYALSTNNTLTVRYQYYRDTETNDGVGQYYLASQGYDLAATEQTVQLSDTQVFGAKIVNETRFQYIRGRNNQTPKNSTPTVNVLYEFVSGGSNLGKVIDSQDHYELQDNTSIAFGKHLLKFGARLRDIHDANDSTANFDGTWFFSSLAAYEANTPLQFTLTTGAPAASVNLLDAGLYIQDDWKWRPNVMLSGGLRFETQNHISDHGDFAPRVAIAWGIGRSNTTPKTVLRAGWGIFYDRFTYDLVLQAQRQNGITEREYIVENPNFYPRIPPLNTLQALTTGDAISAPAIYQTAPNLHAPYAMQTAISVERQLSRVANLSVTYVNARGVHQLLTDNVNAPQINFVPTPLGTRPFGIDENDYRYVSEGVFKQNEVILNFNIRAASKLTLHGYYALNYAKSDTSGPTSFPSNPYNIGLDYGRASFDVRDRAFLGGSYTAPRGLQFSPFMAAATGTPFNVTTGTDLNGDSILNDRPAFVSNAACSKLTRAGNTVCTPLGTFDVAPAPGQAVIPVNAYAGPGQFTFNLRVAKTFGFGTRKEVAAASSGGPGGLGAFGGRGLGGGRGGGGVGRGGVNGGAASNQRYNLTFSVNARNLFNIVNPGQPAGSLGSRRFDRINSLAGGAFGNASAVRMIQLQAQFSF
jgi:carboxypeptidase family protein